MKKQFTIALILGILSMTDSAIATTLETSQATKYAQVPTETLRRGSQGEAVRELQELLKAIGIFNGNITGLYDQTTEAAVRQFQRDRGLIEDGVAGVQTRVAISAVAQSQNAAQSQNVAQSQNPPSSPTNTSRNVASTPSTFTLGSRGNAVRQIQQRLQRLGYFPHSLTGVYDEKTRDATIRFQRDRGLTVDGIVGENTIIALERSVSSQQIRDLQQRLQQAGLYNGQINGIWGTSTQQAIDAAQKRYGLNPTDLMAN